LVKTGIFVVELRDWGHFLRRVEFLLLHHLQLLLLVLLPSRRVASSLRLLQLLTKL
jgi:hypothetical protein